MILRGDALDLIDRWDRPIDLCVTDPPYAFGGAGGEHALSATVAVVLRETARKLAPGAFMSVFAASSWRSTAYMVEAVRGIVEPVRIGTAGWQWASVNVVLFRRGKARDLAPTDALDHITAAPLTKGRRAELPPEVAAWAVDPFAKAGGVFLDPFAGSGALVAAAEGCGMDGFGFERGPSDDDGVESIATEPLLNSLGRGHIW